MAVEVVPNLLDDFGPNLEDRVLAAGAEPKVSIVHEESGAMLLGGDGQFAEWLGHHLESGVSHFILFEFGMLADRAIDDDRGLLRDFVGLCEQLRCDVADEYDALRNSRAVAELQ